MLVLLYNFAIILMTEMKRRYQIKGDKPVQRRIPDDNKGASNFRRLEIYLRAPASCFV